MRYLLTVLAATAIASAADAAGPTPRATVQAMFQAVNAHDAKALSSLYANDAVIISSDTCEPMVGPEAIRRGHESLIKAMPDLRDKPVQWVVDAEQVAVLFDAHSRTLGPSGKTTLADFLTVRNGKIVRDVTIFNSEHPCR